MIIVVACSETCIDGLWDTTVNVELVDPTALIEEKVLAIARPVRGFEVLSFCIDHLSIARGDRNRFQGALDNRLRALFYFYVTEDDLLESVVVMRTNAQADIETSAEPHAEGPAS